MPRIDPIQLLKCLSVLLSPTGGIKSGDEVMRLASLMKKFSKKLVSKCIYIQILKCTTHDLLGLFMNSGGWTLVHMWLTESIVAKNWPLVKEILELLLICPVDIERLKTNNCPKLVKELSKDGNHQAIRALASKIVEQWLKTVKGEIVVPVTIADIPQIISEARVEFDGDTLVKKENLSDLEDRKPSETDIKALKDELSGEVKLEVVRKEIEEDTESSEPVPPLKISLKDKQVITSSKDEKSKSKNKSSDKSSSRSSSKHSSSKSSSSNDKHRSSSSHKSSSSSSSSHRSKDRSKENDRHSSHGSSKSRHSDSSRKSSDKSSSSSSRTKDDKIKDSDKEKKEKSKSESSSSGKIADRTSISKLGKIPKLSDSKKEKPSLSIEVRKPDEPKPKTVKTFHSKFRKHGLEEEVKPPPSRATVLNKKPSLVIPPTVSIPKRPSPVHNDSPPEKKLRTTDIIEKPGAIKLISPKPKPMMLLESDMFMDALNASATNKKEPKKRKRRTSGSKDGNASGDGSPPHTPTGAATSPTGSESKSIPPRFYKDTQETDDEKEKSFDGDETNETNKDKEEPEVVEPHTLTVNGLKGVLCYHKRKGPKKSIRWKPEGELEEVQYFELDETERVNVTKTFTDMKYLERINERDAMQKGRNLPNDDTMEEKTTWRPLIPIIAEGEVAVEYGKKSKEKEIQAVRQKGTLQPLYFHKSMIPDSPFEPDAEAHPYIEPTIIPLEDDTGGQDNVSDFRSMPWPEPKTDPPPANSINVPQMFPTNMPQFPSAFPNGQFQGGPGFQAPNMLPPGDWAGGVPPIMNGMPGVMQPGVMPGGMPPGAMPPGMMMGPDNMMYGAPNPMFQPPDGFNMMDGINMPPNMFPPDFNMGNQQGGPGPDGFHGPPGGFRGPMRGRGAAGGGQWRGKGGNNWDGSQRGRGGPRGGGKRSVCIYFQRKGSCRQGDNCTFLHPGVNCPY